MHTTVGARTLFFLIEITKLFLGVTKLYAYKKHNENYLKIV